MDGRKKQESGTKRFTLYDDDYGSKLCEKTSYWDWYTGISESKFLRNIDFDLDAEMFETMWERNSNLNK